MIAIFQHNAVTEERALRPTISGGGKLTVGGDQPSSARTAKNTTPATTAMLISEFDSKGPGPARTIASLTGGEIASRRPRQLTRSLIARLSPSSAVL